jgi:hypothetical protein
MVAIAWALFALLATVLGVLVTVMYSGLGRIDAAGARTDARIDALSARIDAQTSRIDALASETHAEFRALDQRLSRSGV